MENGEEAPQRRFYTRERRLELAEMEEALPDGSFPIVDVLDLREAIIAVDKAEDPAIAKAHIIKRAQELNEEDELPPDWLQLSGAQNDQAAAQPAAQPATPAAPPEQKSALPDLWDVQLKSNHIVMRHKADIDVVNQEAVTSLTRGRGPRRGNLEDLLKYWRPIMKKPGGFRRCLIILADHPELYPLERICAWLHHETTGKWPNEGKHHSRSRGKKPNSVRVGRRRKRGRRRVGLKVDVPFEIEVKKVGSFGTSSRIGQTAEAVGSSITPGNLSVIRSPVRSSVTRALTPGGGGGIRRPKIGDIVRSPDGGARNKYRCPPGFQFGGTFTDPEFSTCGPQVLALPERGPGSLTSEANQELDALVRKTGLTSTTGNFRSSDDATRIIRASQIKPKPKKGSSNQGVGVGIVLGSLNGGDTDLGDRVVRNDGVILQPVQDREALSAFDEFDDLADGSYVSTYSGSGPLGLEEAAIFSTGLRDAYIFLPGTSNTVRISRDGGELSKDEIVELKPGLIGGLESAEDFIDADPSAAIRNWANSTNGKFEVEIGEVVDNQFVLEGPDEHVSVEVRKGEIVRNVPHWVYIMFLKDKGYNLSGSKSLELKNVRAGTPSGTPGEFRNIERGKGISKGFSKGPLKGQTVGSKQVAEKVAKSLGCYGAHRVGGKRVGPMFIS